MSPLTTAESLVLNAFHEMAGDRVGVPPGYEINRSYLDDLSIRDSSLDIADAISRLEAGGQIERTAEGRYRITDEGVAILYPKRSGDGGVRIAG